MVINLLPHRNFTRGSAHPLLSSHWWPHFGLSDDNLAFNTRVVHSPITIQGIGSAVLHAWWVFCIWYITKWCEIMSCSLTKVKLASNKVNTTVSDNKFNTFIFFLSNCLQTHGKLLPTDHPFLAIGRVVLFLHNKLKISMDRHPV